MALRLIYILLLSFLAYSQAFGVYKRQFNFVHSNFKCEISHMDSDELGYLWISTDEGLVRYDGFSYQRFQHNPGDSLTLPSNKCFKSLIDCEHNFWVATNTGLAKLDRETYEVHNVDFGIKNTPIVDMAEDDDHSLWLLGYDDLFHYFPNTGHVDIVHGCCGIRLLVTKTQVWVVSETRGLTIVDKKTKEKQTNHEGLPKALFRIFQASDGTIFIGSLNQGLYLYSPDGSLIKHYEALNDGIRFTSNHMCAFAEDDKKNVWIGTVNGNLSIYNLNTKAFEAARLMFPDGINDRHVTISAILFDNNRNLWVGTYRYWFFKSAQKDEVFTYHKMPEGYPASSFLSRKGNLLLVGSDGGGVFSFDPLKRNAFQPIPGSASASVASLRSFKNETYMTAWGSGLYVEKNNIFKAHKTNLPTFKLQDVLPSDSGLWVAADGHGVVFITNSGELMSSENSKLDVFSKSLPMFPHHFLSDHKNRLWYASNNGLCCWDGKSCKVYNVSDGHSNDIIMEVEDKLNRIWFLSKSSGLCQLNPTNDSISYLSREYGLPIGLKALLVDEDNHLWVTSADHLFCIDTEKKDVRNYDFSRQFGADVFHPRSLYKSEDGVLYAGTSAGFISVDVPNITSPISQSVVLSSFSLFGVQQTPGESEILKQDISLCKNLTLSYEQNMFSFSFVCPNYSGADQIDYYYKLEGLSDSWVKANGQAASFSSLPAGNYMLDVKAMVGNRQLGSLANPLTIVVQPAWWNTVWFRIFLFLAFSLGVYVFVTTRIRFLKKQKMVLEEQVASRTQQLADRNEEILKQNKDIESKNEELDVALNTKDKIISVLAHDLRNPLTVISGMLGLLQENKEVTASENLSKQIATASNAALNLQNQMENLLQWARLQTSSIVFSPTEVFLSFTVKGAVSLLQDVARQKGINIKVEDTSTHAAIADERMVATIVRNLLANAMKFSYKNGNVDVKIEEKDDKVVLSVKDYGTGISKDLLPTIFANNKATSLASTNGTAGEEGAGLGLRICYDFAVRCKGNLSVTSESGLGSIFYLTLPKSNLERKELAEQKTAAVAVAETVVEEQAELTMEDVDRKSILLVDDDANLLTYLTAIFQGEFMVETASNGEEGLMIAKKSLPNIIISDLMMPLMNGKDFCERIKNDLLTQHIPVLLLTASDSDVTHVESLTVGADDYILKPFHKDILLAKVRTVLRNKERQLQHFRNQIFDLNNGDIQTKSPESDFIEKATEIVKKHVADSDFTAEVFASEMAISRVQLFRKFKAVAATSPSDFVKNYRLKYASELLLAGNATVADVAYACGFSDPKYFSSCFSAQFGMTPSQYAKTKS